MTFGIFWPSLGRALSGAAADRLDVNHSTVLRRISQFEERLGARLFEKLPSGYRLTSAGDEVLRFADQMEASSTSLENCVSGRG